MAAMTHTSHVLGAGTPAPEFALHTTPDQVVSLSEFRGRPVILAFYPADWSPVCGDQMALYNELLDEFVVLELVLVSCKSEYFFVGSLSVYVGTLVSRVLS